MGQSSDEASEWGIRRRIAKLPRSRDGCKTCRIRRIKCDQTKPNCVKCSSTGRWCEWFVKPNGAITPNIAPTNHKTQVLLPATRQTLKHPAIPVPLRSSPYSDAEQRRSFQYFCQRTAPQLSGLFSIRFWGHDLLQASYHNETLRFAIAALGSLHERFEQSDPTVFRTNKDLARGGFALQQYIQSIGSLAKPSDGSSRTEVDVYLIACLLFASFEMLRGHHGSAIQHIHCGVRILVEVGTGSPNVLGKPTITRPKYPLVPLETLAMIFSRLDVQAQQILGYSVYPMGIAKLWQAPDVCYCKEVPEVFETIEAARNSFEYVGSDVNRILVDPPNPYGQPVIKKPYGPEFDQDREGVLDHMRRWTTTLDRTLTDPARGAKFSAQEIQAGQLLRMLGSLIIIALSAAGSDSEMTFDEYTEQYKDAVELAATVAQYGRDPTTPLQGRNVVRPRFQMDTGIIVALFETIRKCRDPAVRRKAIGILESYPFQEGLWDGGLVAVCGREITAVEEGDYGCNLTDGIVPEWARVGEVHVQVDREGGYGHLQLGQTRRIVDGRPTHIFRKFHW